MPGYQGNWTHSFHQVKVSWSTVFFPIIAGRYPKHSLFWPLSRVCPAGSKWPEILLVMNMNMVKMTWENNHAQVFGSTHLLPFFIMMLGSVYLLRNTEGPNVLMQAGLSLINQRISCWVTKAAWLSALKPAFWVRSLLIVFKVGDLRRPRAL